MSGRRRWSAGGLRIGDLDETTVHPDAWIDAPAGAGQPGNGRVRRSHAQVLADARTFAGALAARSGGADGDTRCAIIGPPGYPWLVAALACMLLGRQTVAVPESLPAPQLDACTAGLGVGLVLAVRGQDLTGAFAGAGVLAIDDLLNDPFRQPVRGPLRMDMIAFTSGTTADVKLKCFPVAAESTEHFARTFVDVFRLRPGDTWMVLHTFSHIVHFEYVLAAMLQGVNAVLAQPIDLVLNAKAYQPAAVVTVPGVYERLADTLEARVRRSRSGKVISSALNLLPDSWLGHGAVRRLRAALHREVRTATGGRLKVMIIGAAPSTAGLKRRLLRLGLPLYEGYGMSEIGMATCHRPGDTVLGTIGRPWPGIEARVADGVLLVRTSYRRAAHYLNVDGAEAAIVDAQGWIDTGDLARELPNGHFVVTGRRKHTVVTDRGRNVNSRAVEARVEELAGVGQVVLYGDGRPFLSAVIQLRKPGFATGFAERMERLNAEVPEHERILRWVFAHEPFDAGNGLLTRSGKVRRGAVIERYRARLEAIYDGKETG